MSACTSLRRGWCPSLAQPMPSGDGLLARLHLPCGTLPPALARGIARCARAFGNGLVDLTRHGNLQLRGLSEAILPGLRAELATLLAPTAGDEPQATRDIVASPLAGLDPAAACDIRPVVAALEEKLAADPSLQALPAKFCFLVDDGGTLRLDDIAADIRFVGMAGADGPRFAIALGGNAADAAPVGSCTIAELPKAAAALTRAFLDLRHTKENALRRMADLVEHVGAEAIVRAVPPGSGAAVHPWVSAHLLRSKTPMGFHALGAETGFLGIGAPFGRLSADQLEQLAEAAEASEAELRLTPWRAIVIAPIDGARAERLRHSLGKLGLIVEPDDPRLAIAACPGAPACANASVSTREDAPALARLARAFAQEPCGHIGLHLSGCAKGCAKSDATPVTLIGRDGRYDLVLDGRPGDAPAHSGLTAPEAEALLRRIYAERRRPGDAHFTRRIGTVG